MIAILGLTRGILTVNNSGSVDKNFWLNLHKIAKNPNLNGTSENKQKSSALWAEASSVHLIWLFYFKHVQL